LKALNDTVEAVGQWKEENVPSISISSQQHAKMILASFSTHLIAICQLDCYEMIHLHELEMFVISDGLQKVEVSFIYLSSDFEKIELG
jgi:hypothetical protein